MFCCKSYEDGRCKMIMRAYTCMSRLTEGKLSMDNKKTQLPNIILCLTQIAS
jgi:hypothetical protein